VDVNPVFGKVNRVWVTVRNRGDIDVTNARVRYYWANPFAGFAPSNWQLIPGTTGHPNPTNTFTVPANSSVAAPYVEWVPAPVPGVSDPAHQCLLAIAHINDDPKDRNNPDPLVYPFEIAWDNNIAARNVHVVTLKKGSKAKLQLGVAVPIDGVDELDVDLRIRLAYVPRLPVFGVPATIVPPRISMTLENRRPIRLTETRKIAPVGRTPGRSTHGAKLGILDRRGETRGEEATIAMKKIKDLHLVTKKPIPLRIELVASHGGKAGDNFLLFIEQEIHGQVSGAYVVAITTV
jgi:hypothetical protein